MSERECVRERVRENHTQKHTHTHTDRSTHKHTNLVGAVDIGALGQLAQAALGIAISSCSQ